MNHDDPDLYPDPDDWADAQADWIERTAEKASIPFTEAAFQLASRLPGPDVEAITKEEFMRPPVSMETRRLKQRVNELEAENLNLHRAFVALVEAVEDHEASLAGDPDDADGRLYRIRRELTTPIEPPTHPRDRLQPLTVMPRELDTEALGAELGLACDEIDAILGRRHERPRIGAQHVGPEPTGQPVENGSFQPAEALVPRVEQIPGQTTIADHLPDAAA